MDWNNDIYIDAYDEEERRRKHSKKKREAMLLRKKRARKLMRIKLVASVLFIAAIVLATTVLVSSIVKIVKRSTAVTSEAEAADFVSEGDGALLSDDAVVEETGLLRHPTKADLYYSLDNAGYSSDYMVLIDTDSNEVLAGKAEQECINPASMTKVMTLIVAVEQIALQNKENATYTFTRQDIDQLYLAEASVVGYVAGETAGVTDLLYGLILPSGGDAALALANIVAGGEDEFVELMNAKAVELGLTNTHFTNSIGLYDEDHYTTPVEMAMIMEYAMSIEGCAQVLTTSRYTTSPTLYHNVGIALVSTTYSRFGAYKSDNATILGGKTGFTDEAGYCMVVAIQSTSGRNFIMLASHGAARLDPATDIINFIDNDFNEVIGEVETEDD